MTEFTTWATSSIPGLLLMAVIGNAVFAGVWRLGGWFVQYILKSKNTRQAREEAQRIFLRNVPDRVFISYCVMQFGKVLWEAVLASMVGMCTFTSMVLALGSTGFDWNAELPLGLKVLVLAGASIMLLIFSSSVIRMLKVARLVYDLYFGAMDAIEKRWAEEEAKAQETEDLAKDAMKEAARLTDESKIRNA